MLIRSSLSKSRLNFFVVMPKTVPLCVVILNSCAASEYTPAVIRMDAFSNITAIFRNFRVRSGNFSSRFDSFIQQGG